jgi:hypothetical protein
MSTRSNKSNDAEAKTNGATPPPAMGADLRLFENLDQLRVADPAQLGGDTEILVHVYVRKPKKDEYFRVNPEPDMTLTTLVWIDPDEGDAYLVAPEARDLMAESGRVVILVPCQNRQGVNFLWPVSAGTRAGGGRGWGESARAAMIKAQTRWIKIRGDRAAGAYLILDAAEQQGEPTWPTLNLSEMLKIAFKDRVIHSADHPVVRRLQGYI